MGVIMDKLKRIKSLILLMITMMTLSGCSKEEIANNLKNNYKIVHKMDDELNVNYYLIKMDRINNKSFNIIGEFETMEEAREYLDMQIIRDKDQILNEAFLSGSVIIIVGTAAYLCVGKQKKEEKTKVLRK